MENKSNERDDDTKELNLYNLMERHPCPFYGFESMYEIDAKNCENSRQIMKDKGGDQCALATIINSDKLYCSMESIKNKPNWATCEFNTKENREKIGKNLDKIMVFPKEFEPANKESWSGLPLRIWIRHVDDLYS